MHNIAQDSRPEIVGVGDLLPTQMTVGMREVELKRKRWREKNCSKAASYLNAHRIPVILGPGTRPYIIDRHHLALALYDEGVGEIPISIVANLSGLGFNQFWSTLESCNWARPFDDEGRRCSYSDMPVSVDELIDDPFRSLAGAVRRSGGYVKDKSPFSEFRWADFLRRRIAREQIDRDFGRSLALAMNLAQSTEAAALPGWRRHPEQ